MEAIDQGNQRRVQQRSQADIVGFVSEIDQGKLSVAEMAKRERVSLSAVYQWRKRVHREISSVGRVVHPEPIEIIPSRTVAPGQEALIRLEFSTGISCVVCPGFDVETLTQVMKAALAATEGTPQL